MEKVKLRVPATTANLGPGFDSFGCALSVVDDGLVFPCIACHYSCCDACCFWMGKIYLFCRDLFSPPAPVKEYALLNYSEGIYFDQLTSLWL